MLILFLLAVAYAAVEDVFFVPKKEIGLTPRLSEKLDSLSWDIPTEVTLVLKGSVMVCDENNMGCRGKAGPVLKFNSCLDARQFVAAYCEFLHANGRDDVPCGFDKPRTMQDVEKYDGVLTMKYEGEYIHTLELDEDWSTDRMMQRKYFNYVCPGDDTRDLD